MKEIEALDKRYGKELNKQNINIKNEKKRYFGKEQDNYVTFLDLQRIVKLKFGSISKFGQALGVGRSRAFHILHGQYVPKRPETIKRVSEVLDINIVMLTKLFGSVKNEKDASTKKI